MKKRLLAVLAAATLVLSSATGVFAASATKDVAAVKNETTDANNYYETTQDVTKTETFVALKELTPESATLIEKVNAGKISTETFLEEIAALDDVSADVADNIEGKEMLSPVMDLEKVGEPQKVNGKYRVTLKIPGLTADMTGLGALHLRSDGIWEFVPAVPGSINLTNKTADFDFETFSPVIIVAANKSTADAPASSDKEDSAGSDKGSSSDKDSSKDSSSKDKSPKTAQTFDWMTWAVMAVVLAGAGVVALRRKEN